MFSETFCADILGDANATMWLEPTIALRERDPVIGNEDGHSRMNTGTARTAVLTDGYCR